MNETQREAKRLRVSSAWCRHSLKVPKFQTATALQHCLNHLPPSPLARLRRMNVTPLRRRRDGVIAPYRCGDRQQTFRPAYVRFTVVSSFVLSFQFAI